MAFNYACYQAPRKSHAKLWVSELGPNHAWFLKEYSRRKMWWGYKMYANCFFIFVMFCRIYAIIAIKHELSFINIRKVPREGWKSWATPSVFNTSLRTLRMLMNGKSCLIPLLLYKGLKDNARIPTGNLVPKIAVAEINIPWHFDTLC